MKKRAAFLICTGVLLLAASVSLVVNNQLESAKAAKSAEELAQAFLSRSIVYEAPLTEQMSGLAPGEGGSGVTLEQTPAKKFTIIDGQEYIGMLSIPSLSVNLPVNNDISYLLLKATPCRYYGSVDEGSLIIAAHNYDSHFGKIGSLKYGDKVNLSDANGFSDTYSVSEVQILPGSAIEGMLNPEGWDLTLFTCNYSGTERVTVRCVKEDRL